MARLFGAILLPDWKPPAPDCRIWLIALRINFTQSTWEPGKFLFSARNTMLMYSARLQWRKDEAIAKLLEYVGHGGRVSGDSLVSAEQKRKPYFRLQRFASRLRKEK
jgi:hypothetical protein